MQKKSKNNDQAYFYICPHCGEVVDRRNLGQVMYHEHSDNIPAPCWESYRRVGEPVEYFNSELIEEIYLN